MDAYVVRVRKVYPSLPSRRPPQDRRPFPWRWVWRPFFDFCRFFSHPKKRLKFETSKNYFFSRFSRFLAPPASIFANSGAKMGPRRVDFRRFFEKPDFLKIELSMVIWPHFEGPTLQKSVWRAIPNGNGAKKHKKLLPALPPDALFRLRARSWSILGAFWPPKNENGQVTFSTFF